MMERETSDSGLREAVSSALQPDPSFGHRRPQ
jgi:hypothetical protein